MSFEFIDHSQIDRKSRQVIRSHVAKSQNISRAVSRKHQGSRSKKFRAGINETLLENAQVPVHPIRQPPLEWQFSDSYAVIPFPTEMNLQSRGLVQQFFTLAFSSICPPELAHAIDHAYGDSIWVRFVFQDEACLHSTIAVSILISNHLSGNPSDFIGDSKNCESALHRIQQALRLVNSRLSSEEALADRTMAAIMSLSQYERARGQHHQRSIHLDALQRIVALRGGIGQLLRDKPAITQKVFRADIEQALFQGVPTRFHVHEVPGQATIAWLRNRSRSSSTSFAQSKIFAGLGCALQEVFIDTMATTWLLNGSDGQGIKLLGYTFHDLLIHVGYRIVDVCPLIDRQQLRLHEDVLQLGLLSFMATFLMPLSHSRLQCPLLIDVSRSAAQRPFDEKKCSQRVFIWFLFIAAATIFSQEDDAWLIPVAAQTVSILRLQTWSEVCGVLSKFPWIHSIHQKSGISLWNKIQSITSDG